jgi:uncharacterized protein
MKQILLTVLLLTVFVFSFLANANAQLTATMLPTNVSLNATLNQMPDTRQSTEYSCAAACMQAVARYWGRDIAEQDIMELLNTNEESGTYPDDILRASRELGLEANYKENLTLEEIEASLKDGVPVIIDCQAWRSVSEYNESWADEWDNGHWMVIIGIDEKNVYFEDPYILGDRGFMSRQEFVERWHNPRGLDESDTVKQIHLGIFVNGEKTPSTIGLKHVD